MVVQHYPTRTVNVSFVAHQGRVSYLTVSPDNESIATASNDETLRFFKVRGYIIPIQGINGFEHVEAHSCLFLQVFPPETNGRSIIGNELLGGVR
jgi:WD40 repeat protein